MDLRDEGAGGIDGVQAARFRLGPHRRGNPMGRENDDGLRRNVRDMIHEPGADGAQSLHDVPVETIS